MFKQEERNGNREGVSIIAIPSMFWSLWYAKNRKNIDLDCLWASWTPPAIWSACPTMSPPAPPSDTRPWHKLETKCNKRNALGSFPTRLDVSWCYMWNVNFGAPTKMGLAQFGVQRNSKPPDVKTTNAEWSLTTHYRNIRDFTTSGSKVMFTYRNLDNYCSKIFRSFWVPRWLTWFVMVCP